jgi:hypothetical protein
VKALSCIAIALLAAVLSAPALAQTSMPPPANPVVFCGAQATPNADSYELIFDGGAPEPLAMDATLNAACPGGSTHSFSQPASRFTVGAHTLIVRGTNPFGSTDGPQYNVLVGIMPGQFTINAVIAP